MEGQDGRREGGRGERKERKEGRLVTFNKPQKIKEVQRYINRKRIIRKC